MGLERLFDSISEADVLRRRAIVEQVKLLENGNPPLFYQGRDPASGKVKLSSNSASQERVAQLMTNIQPNIGQVGSHRGYDIGSNARRQKNRRIEGNPDVKQLVFVRRATTDQLWVRSQMQALMIEERPRLPNVPSKLVPDACSLSSTGPKITDFIVLINSPPYGNANQRSNVHRYDGLKLTTFYRSAVPDTGIIAYLITVGKRGFWINDQPGWIQYDFLDSTEPNQPGLYDIIKRPDPYQAPRRIGSIEVTSTSNIYLKHILLNYDRNAYYSIGYNAVQTTNCVRLADYTTGAITAGSTITTDTLAADDFGNTCIYQEILSYDNSTNTFLGQSPIDLGTYLSKARVIFDYNTKNLIFLKDPSIQLSTIQTNLTDYIFGIAPIFDDYPFSHATFDDDYLYYGELSTTDKNKVFQKKYPIENIFDSNFLLETTTINFATIPDTEAMIYESYDPRSLTHPDVPEFWAIAYDIGDRIPSGSVQPDQLAP